jgi:CubicO group peptidase (beta-lactamase class C family)
VATIHGFCDDRFGPVRDTLAASIDGGGDIGASVAIYLGGEPVVDIWGGLADRGSGRPWERDTITNTWSTTKTMTALCALMLADRGELDLHAPVASYWPEFAAAGKERIEVRHLLGHTAGLWTWNEPMTVEDLFDWEKATDGLARQETAWEPGTSSGYHALTQGYLVGEVVRRVTGRSLGTFFREEVAEPLGADFHIGLPAEHDDRVTPVVPAEETQRVGNPPVRPEDANSLEWRRAEIPAAGGHGNARSVAAVQSVLAGGGEARGVRLLSKEGSEAVFEQQSDGEDRFLRIPVRFGMGYGLPSTSVPLPNPRSCYWGGWGGSVVIVDMDANLTITYMMNRMMSGMTGDERGAALIKATYMSLLA